MWIFPGPLLFLILPRHIAAALDPANLGLSAIGATGALLVFLYFTRQALTSMKDRLAYVEARLINAESYIGDLVNALIEQNVKVPRRPPMDQQRRKGPS